MAIGIRVVGPPLDAQLDRNLEKYRLKVQAAIDSATDQLAETMVEKGREDIASAGKFGSRWTTEGLTSDVSGSGTIRTITIREAVPYWRVFQNGAIIQGKPLLWIPLSFATEAQGVSAKDYPGRLFRVDRKSGGVPLLMSADDKQPKYSGHESVRIPKKFHLVEIVTAEAKTFGALYRVEMTKS
jgi:hypothetical protein